jgi:hypothetical protein
MLAVCAGGPRIDAVFFTGDATYSGQADQFALFHRWVVEPILEALALRPNRFYIVPGNHDVNRGRIQKLMERGLRDAVSSGDSADALWRNEEERAPVLERLSAFYDFAKQSQLQFAPNILQVGNETIGICCLNSAWTSSSEPDRNKLVITRAQVDDQYSQISSAPVRVALWHHPLDWLVDDDKVRVQERMSARFDLYCMGHMHEDGGARLSSPHGECYAFQAPALLASKAQTGFLIYEISSATRQLTATSYRWDDRRATYHASPDFAPQNGVWKAPLPNRTGLDDKTLTLRSRVSQDLRTEYQSRLLRHFPPSASIEARDVEQRFIEPHLVGSNGKRERTLHVQDILKDNKSYLITGDRHSGKTTLLDYIGAKLSALGRVALQVDFSEISNKPERRGLVALLSERLNKSKTQAEKMLGGPVALLIDNAVDQPDRPEWAIIEHWHSSCSSLRVIAVGSPCVLPSEDKIPGSWVRVMVNPLPLPRIRDELSRSGRISGESVGRKLEASLNTLIDAELPRWPWVILILTELANRSLAGDITNIVSLLRTYTELRLGFFESALGDRPRIRARMLRILSAKMMEQRRNSLTHAEAIELIHAEMQACAIDANPRDLMGELINSQLLIRDGEELAFVFFVMQEFFYADHLREKMWSDTNQLDGDSLIRRGGSLVFLAEMVTLPKLVERCFAIAKEHLPEGAKPLRIEDLADLTHLLPDDSPEDAVSRAKKGALSDDEMGHVISTVESTQAGTRLHRVRHGKEGLEALGQSIYQFMSAVGVLRSSMWLTKEAKLAAVKEAVDLATVLVAEIVRDEQLTAAIMDLVSPNWRSSKKELAGFISATMLLILGHIIAETGGARHLGTTVREMFMTEADELRRLLLLMWYSELGGEGTSALVDKLLEETSSNTVVGMLEYWLTVRFINSVSFGSTDALTLESMLRQTVQERMRRTSNRSALEIKILADQQMQQTRKLKLQHSG